MYKNKSILQQKLIYSWDLVSRYLLIFRMNDVANYQETLTSKTNDSCSCHSLLIIPTIPPIVSFRKVFITGNGIRQLGAGVVIC